jgi:site-specific recombinase XerD
MSTIFLRPNGIYYLVLKQRNGSRRWISTKTRNRSEALRVLANHESNPQIAEQFPRLSEFMNDLIPYTKSVMSSGTVSIYEKALQFFLRFTTDIRIDKITQRQIDLYKIKRLETVKKTTLNIELRSLRAGFEHAVRWGLLPENPFRKTKLCSIDEKPPLFLSPIQYKTLIMSVKEPWLKQMIVLGALTGLRRNELLYLTWRNIDFQRRIIYLFSKPNFRTKNGKARIVPLNESAIKLLLLCNEVKTSEYVFSFAGGGPVTSQHVSRTFKKYIRDQNLDPGLTFHSLRHTFASWLVQSGATLFEVQKLMGHSNSRVTEIYSHLLPQTLHHVVQMIDPARLQ